MDLSNANDRAIDAHTNELGDEAKREEWITERALGINEEMLENFQVFKDTLKTLFEESDEEEMQILFYRCRDGSETMVGRALEGVVVSGLFNIAKKELES